MKRTRHLLTLATTLTLLCLAQISLAQGNSQNAGNGNGNSNAGGNGIGKAFGRSRNIGVGNASDGIKGRIITGKRIAYTGDPLEISLQFPRGAELVTSGVVDAYVVVFSPLVGDEDRDDDGLDSDSDDDSNSSTDSDDDSSASSDDDSGSDSDDDADSDDDSDSEDDSDSDDDSDSSSDDDTSDDDSDDSSGTARALSDAVVLPVSSDASVRARQLFAIGAVDLSVLPAGTYQLGLILTNPGGDPLNINDWYAGLLGLIDIVGLTVTNEAVPFDSDGDGEVDDDSDGDGFSDDDGDDEDEDEDDDGDDDDATSDTTI